MYVEQEEEDVRNSGKVVVDQELNSYVKGVVCKLEPEYCDDIRVYVLNVGGPFAGVSPNGAMYIGTGLLLRLENEAQLASVLAREMVHYRQRHTLAQWRDLREKFDSLVIKSSLIGWRNLDSFENSIYSFSQDQKVEADDLGFDRMVAAGYDPREVSRFWKFVVAEETASEYAPANPFKSTHPPSELREQALAKKLAALGELPAQLELGDARYREKTARFRSEWLEQEVKTVDFGQVVAMVDRLLERDPKASDLHYAKGEMLRRRGADGDLALAVSAYESALSGEDYPPEVHRSLGLVKWTQGQTTEALEAFQGYLDRKPDADDRLIIESYIGQLK